MSKGNTRKTITLKDGIRDVRSAVHDVLDRTRPLSTMIGMAPCSFYGSATEDVNIFIAEADKARRYNQWTGAEAVVRLAYFLEGNARYAFDAEVADRLARLKTLTTNADVVNWALGARGAGDGGAAGAYPTPTVGRRATTTNESAAAAAPANGRPAAARESAGKLFADGVDSGGRLPGSAGGATASAEDGQSAHSTTEPGKPSTEVQAWNTVIERFRGSLKDLFTDSESYDAALQVQLTRLAQADSDTKLNELQYKVSLDELAAADSAGSDAVEALELQFQAARAGLEATRVDCVESMSKLQSKLASNRVKQSQLQHDERTAVAALTQAVAREGVAAAAAADTEAAETAAVVAEDDTALAFPSFEEFCDWLRKIFEREDVTNAYMSEFYGRRQQRGERVQDFAYEVMRLSQRSGMLVTEAERSRHFLDGLTPRMRKHIKRLWQAKGVTGAHRYRWNDLLAKARQLERDIPELSQMYEDEDRDAVAGRKRVVASGLRVVNSPYEVAGATVEDEEEEVDSAAVMAVAKAPPHVVANRESSSQAELIKALGEMMKACMAQGGGGGGRRGGSRTCYNCGKEGHISRDCQEPESASTKQYRLTRRTGRGREPECYTCHEMGHYSPDCPQKTSADTGSKAGGRDCYVCGEKGHIARDCPSKADSEKGGRP